MVMFDHGICYFYYLIIFIGLPFNFGKVAPLNNYYHFVFTMYLPMDAQRSMGLILKEKKENVILRQVFRVTALYFFEHTYGFIGSG